MGREERVTWEQPRPSYVRESEPAGPHVYFKSVPFMEYVDGGTIVQNCELALRDMRGGRPRKSPALRRERGRMGHPE
jgi:hypothetical protein